MSSGLFAIGSWCSPAPPARPGRVADRHRACRRRGAQREAAHHQLVQAFPGTQSQQALDLLNEKFPGTGEAQAQVVFSVPAPRSLTDATERQAVEAALAELRGASPGRRCD